MTHLAAGRQRSVMARPIRPSMPVGVTPRLHPEIVRSRNETTSSLLFTTGSSHVEIVRVNRRYCSKTPSREAGFLSSYGQSFRNPVRDKGRVADKSESWPIH